MLIGGKGQDLLKVSGGRKGEHACRSTRRTEGQSSRPSNAGHALVGRIFGSCIGFMEILSIHVVIAWASTRLSWRMTATAQLADATATDERYARGAARTAAVAAILEVDDADAQPGRKALPAPEGPRRGAAGARQLLLRGAACAADGEHNASATGGVGGVQDRRRGAPIPTPGRTCARASPTPTGRCSSTSWAPSGCPLYPTRTNGCEPTRPRGWPTSRRGGGRASRSPELPQGAR